MKEGPVRICQQVPGFTTLTFLAVATVSLICPLELRAGGVVASNTDAALRAAMVGGGTVTFAIDGVITLTSSLTVTNDTIIDGTGHNVTISGAHVVRLFNVNTGVSAAFLNLTLADGRHVGSNGVVSPIDPTTGKPGMGGAISNSGGTVLLTGCTIANNNATGGTGDPQGGGGGQAWGGAIFNSSGNVFATNCSFVANECTGGAATGGIPGPLPNIGFSGGDTQGAAICSFGGTVTIKNCAFEMNTAKGGVATRGAFGSSEAGGSSFGGALWTANATVNLYESTFTSNEAIGGTHPGSSSGGSTGSAKGGALFATNGVVNCVGCTFLANVLTVGSVVSSAPLGAADGGAIWSHAVLTISQCSFFDNYANGNGNVGFTTQGGGDASGGAIYTRNILRLNASLFAENLAQGGPAGVLFSRPGGNARGGAIYNLGTLLSTNCTFFANSARGGAVQQPTTATTGGIASGGALFNTNGSMTLINLTFLSNSVAGGIGNLFPGIAGLPAPVYGGAIFNGGGTSRLGNTIVAYSISNLGTNSALATNYFGSIINLGNNLNSQSPGFSGPGSINNTNPVLGPLDDYGGPTLTLPLLAGSPALNAGNTALGPTTDQRGRSRPSGAATDIGAFESSAPFVIRGRISGFTLQDEIPVFSDTASTTTVQGHYSLTVNAGANTVTPTNSNYVFFPANQLIATGPDQLNVDFKAYRWNTLSVEGISGGNLRLMFAGTNGESYRVLSTTNLLGDWLIIATKTPVSSNLFDIVYPTAPDRQRYFRISQP